MGGGCKKEYRLRDDVVSEKGQTSSNFPLASQAPSLPSGSLKTKHGENSPEANPTASDMLARAQSPACAAVMPPNQFLPSSQRSITEGSDYRPVCDVASDAAFPRMGLGMGRLWSPSHEPDAKKPYTAEFGWGQSRTTPRTGLPSLAVGTLLFTDVASKRGSLKVLIKY
ncbi:unnamed protein product [Clonostachys solani]|uniref:Uncharacterized protein n=1 Tax=Clonostachys solani TaxID=160281 RepID=A0A9N9YYX0_9HYPO|nr:unnamed protein product [Clonostachys solani]